jgi:hypothetical protein
MDDVPRPSKGFLGLCYHAPSRYIKGRKNHVRQFSIPKLDKGLRTFSWRLNERILCSVKRSVVVPWSCISPLI